MSRFWLCFTDVAVIFWWRFNESFGMCQDVFGMYWECFGDVLVMCWFSGVSR